MTTRAAKTLIISNRLPITVKRSEKGLVFDTSDGGLASAMSKLTQQKGTIWIGWPGIASDDLTKTEKQEIEEYMSRQNCHPVFLNQEQIDKFYSGYCNGTLWPLLHYFTQLTEHDAEAWASYKAVNQVFAEATRPFIDDKSQVWVHDYQLMLLPKLIRQENRDTNIGFFLHTPFPSHEIFRLLPEREALLEGLLGADLVGFHTYDYVRHFLSTTLRTLGHDSFLGSIKVGNRLVKTDAFPIGIDYKKFAKTDRLPLPRKSVASSLSRKTKLVLSVDRADYTKGIPERLRAYHQFLRDNPDYHGKVTMVMLAIPSREDIHAYQDLVAEVEQTVSHINGEFSTVDWSPISYIHGTMQFNELLSLYRRADVMLVTPLRDGMNLVAKEFVAAKQRETGVLILSELAGAASELQEALQVNPHHSEQVTDAISTALAMPKGEQRQRLKTMQKRISSYNNVRWAHDFIAQLELTKGSKHKLNYLDDKTKNKLKKEYKKTQKRLILLDYDGTLTGFTTDYRSSKVNPDIRLKAILRSLHKDPANQVVIISGRPKLQMANWFNRLGVGLVAEHGGWVKFARLWAKNKVAKTNWKAIALPKLEHYADRTPGAIIEEKDFALVWHYRAVSPELAYVRRNELESELRQELEGHDVAIYHGNKILEIKPNSVNKGAVAAELERRGDWDFILAMGDDRTDEDMFASLPSSAHTIKVGVLPTEAKYRVSSVKDAVALLSELSDIK